MAFETVLSNTIISRHHCNLDGYKHKTDSTSYQNKTKPGGSTLLTLDPAIGHDPKSIPFTLHPHNLCPEGAF